MCRRQFPSGRCPQVANEAPDAVRYYEESAVALAAAAAREGRAAPTARLLAPLFPGNAYLALGTTAPTPTHTVTTTLPKIMQQESTNNFANFLFNLALYCYVYLMRTSVICST